MAETPTGRLLRAHAAPDQQECPDGRNGNRRGPLSASHVRCSLYAARSRSEGPLPGAAVCRCRLCTSKSASRGVDVLGRLVRAGPLPDAQPTKVTAPSTGAAVCDGPCTGKVATRLRADHGSPVCCRHRCTRRCVGRHICGRMLPVRSPAGFASAIPGAACQRGCPKRAYIYRQETPRASRSGWKCAASGATTGCGAPTRSSGLASRTMLCGAHRRRWRTPCRSCPPMAWPHPRTGLPRNRHDMATGRKSSASNGMHAAQCTRVL